jgi:hypothetical protein
MKQLESYKAFSVVAWLTVVLFSLFTYALVRDLEQTVAQLDVLNEKQQSAE